MGKGKAITIGYRHFMVLFMLEARRVNYLAGIQIGDETAFEGEFVGSGTMFINRPMLFGGDKKEGGIVGQLEIRTGEATQMPSSLLEASVPGPWPAHRGLTTTVFNGQVGAMNPYIKLWKKRWGGFDAGWTTPVWEPSLIRIGRGKNPIHILYQCFTDLVMGMGLSTSAIDEESFRVAAQTCYDEEFGICLPYRRSDGGIANYVQAVCDHVGGTWGVDPQSGKITFRLFRKDYDVDTLVELNKSNIKRVEKFDTPVLDGSTNELTVIGKDILSDKDISATWHNQANILAQGRTVSDKRRYDGLWNRDLVKRVAQRDGEIESSLLSRITLVTKGNQFWNARRGDVFALTWPKKKWVRVPVRVIDVDRGERTNSEVALQLMQDFSGMADGSYISSGGSVWVPPNQTPEVLAHQRVYEATYRDLASVMRSADLELVQPESGYLVALARRPTGSTSYGFDLMTRVGSVDFDTVAAGDYAPNGLLSTSISREASSVTLTDAVDLELVEIGSEWICDSEHGRVTSVDAASGFIGIARGCVDTVPAVHLAGARMWFSSVYRAEDPTEYVTGETVNAKLFCRTRFGILPEGSVSAVNVAMNSRQARPYPPGRVRVAGSVDPAAVSGAFVVTWAPRDRVLQADQLIDQEAGPIGPEDDVRYALRFLDASSTVLVAKLDIAGGTATVSLAYTGQVTMELYAINDAGGSLQKHLRVFSYTPPGGGGPSSISAPTWTPVEVVIDGGEVTP